jgi:hypothetical protein
VLQPGEHAGSWPSIGRALARSACSCCWARRPCI